MKRITLFVFVVACMLLPGLVPKASAQYYYYDKFSYDNPITFELGGSLGIMNCLTDLGGKKGIGKRFIKDLNLGNTQFNGSIYLCATYHYAYALRLEGTFGRVKAYDSILASVAASTSGRYERNLSFQSRITEISLIAEFHPLFIFINWEGRDEEPPRISPYLAVGIGYYSFNPQAKIGNRLVDLQPLSTEGEGFAEYTDRPVYKLHQVNVPVGIGVKYEASALFNIRLEFLHRILFTDYLDDVSTRYIDPTLFSTYFTGQQRDNAIALNSNYRLDPPHNFNHNAGGIRGNPKNNDAYFTFNLKVGLTFGREKVR